VMNPFKISLAMVALSALTLTACSGEKAPVGGADKPAIEASNKNAIAGGPLALGDGIAAMKTDIKSLTDSVKAGDFSKAKDEALKVQDTWNKVKSSATGKSADSYKTINDNLFKAKSELAKSSPDKAAVLSSVQAISGALGGLIASK
jgi:hypothetical protein